MAKLTEAEKAANKAASKRRNEAYKVRQEEFRAARNAAEAAVEAGAMATAYHQCRKDVDTLLTERNAVQQKFRDQIALLQQQMAEAVTSRQDKIDAAKRHEREVEKDYHQQLREARDAVAAKYPDMKDVWSAAAWKSLDEFK